LDSSNSEAGFGSARGNGIFAAETKGPKPFH
jgi:hypothetical protein